MKIKNGTNFYFVFVARNMSHPNFGAKRLRSSQIYVLYLPSAPFFQTHRHIENIVKSTLRYVFYVSMWLNYSTGVVEHIDLTASQSFRAKIQTLCLHSIKIKSALILIDTYETPSSNEQVIILSANLTSVLYSESKFWILSLHRPSGEGINKLMDYSHFISMLEETSGIGAVAR